MRCHGCHHHAAWIGLVLAILVMPLPLHSAPEAAADPGGPAPSLEEAKSYEFGRRYPFPEEEPNLPLAMSTIAVVVTDSSGNPISGAAIRSERTDIRWSRPRVEVSDGRGRSAVTGLLPGRYAFCIDAEGFFPFSLNLDLVQSRLYDLKVYLRPGEFSAGDGECRVRLKDEVFQSRLVESSRLDGRITDLDRVPIPDAVLRFEWRNASGPEIRTLTSGAQGTFSLSGLPLGKFRVLVSAQGYRPVDESLELSPCGDYALECSLRKRNPRETSLESLLDFEDAFDRAMSLVDQKRFVEAMPLLEKVIAIPASTEAADGSLREQLLESRRRVEAVYGTIQFEVGKQDETRRASCWKNSESLLLAALSRQPSNEHVLQCLLEMAEGRKDSAATSRYRAAIQAVAAPPSGNLIKDGLLAFRAHRYPEAEAALLKAIQETPNHAESHYLLGLTLEKLGRSQAALVAFRKVLELEPEGSRARRVQQFLRARARNRVPRKSQGGVL